MLILTLLENPLLFLLWVAAVVVALTVHEFSHGLSAKLQGDPTAEMHDRLNLNPLNHIDWIGFALLIVAGFGWAKPTPFNPYNLKFKKWGGALVALAGPISNFLVAIVVAGALLLCTMVFGLGADNPTVIFLVLLMYVNVLLGAFNLIPVPPLDGSKILYGFIEDKWPEIVQGMERYGMILLFILIFYGDGLLRWLIGLFFGLLQQGIALVSPETVITVFEVMVQL